MGTFPICGNVPKNRNKSVNCDKLVGVKKRQVTIIDIARALNMSKSTVSRALTGHKSVSEKTRLSVLEYAEQSDYQRNMHAISLITHKSNTIGIIVPEFMSSFFPQIIMEVQEVATKAGYNTVICQSNETYETEVANTKVMLANQVDGLLISITRETRNFDHLKVFQRKGIPIVFFNRVCDEMNVPKVIVDDYDGAFHAVEHLIRNGRKRIAHIAGPPSLIISTRRLNGYKAALKKYEMPVDEELIIPYDLNIEKVKIYVNHLLSLKRRPDAIFAVNDPTAIETILTVKKAGLRIPEDVAVVGFSNDYVSGLIEPSLTTVSQPVKEIGRVATQLAYEHFGITPNRRQSSLF